jgi:hypothetical protein
MGKGGKAVGEYFNRFTSSGGGGMLLGVGIWLTQGGIYRPVPTPPWYWVGVSCMVIGAMVVIYGLFHGSKLVREGDVQLLGDIKADLVTLNNCEREAATKKAMQPCPKETALRIYEDFVALFGAGAITPAISIIQEVIKNRSVDPLVEFFKKYADILDNNGYGLKADLEDNELYKSSRMDVAQKRLKLRMGKKKKAVTQKNINRVLELTYGLNCSILLKRILSPTPEAREFVPVEIRIALEGAETVGERVLNDMLNDLENEWKVNIDYDKVKIWFPLLSALSQSEKSNTMPLPQSPIELKGVTGLKEATLARVKSELANKISKGVLILDDTNKMAQDLINGLASQRLILDIIGITKDDIKRILDELKADEK